MKFKLILDKNRNEEIVVYAKEKTPLIEEITVLYCAYVLCYLANTWLPFEPIALLIFTGVFIGAYAVVWTTVFLIVRNTSKKLNQKIIKSGGNSAFSFYGIHI